MSDLWIRLDEVQDVACSIRHSLRTAEFVADDPQAWKWFALAVHSALQGACVCHLTTTASPVGALDERSTRKWLEHFEASRSDPDVKPPKIFLLNLPQLLDRVRQPNSAGDGGCATGIAVSDAELDWLRRIHDEIRNQFVHFEPRGWALEVSGLPGIAKLSARIIRDILENGWAFRHADSDLREQIGANLAALENHAWPV
jgi:hypothetical protein